jgi:hypothetical protein
MMSAPNYIRVNGQVYKRAKFEDAQTLENTIYTGGNTVIKSLASIKLALDVEGYKLDRSTVEAIEAEVEKCRTIMYTFKQSAHAFMLSSATDA